MREVLKKRLLGPLLRRVGTVAATALLALGFPTEMVEQAVTVVSAMIMLGFDLWLAKRAEQK